MLFLISVISLGLIAINLLVFHWIWLGILASLILFLTLGRQNRNYFYTAIVSLTWLIISGAFFYYTFKLNNLTILISLLTLPLIFKLIKLPESQKIQKRTLIFSVVAFSVFGLLMMVLWRGQTGEAIVSPWPEVHPLFFILFFTLILISFIKNSKIASLLVLVAASSVALIIYKNGFGFDQFIHQAAEKYIQIHGEITPKTLYYAGHYALVLILSGITAVPLTVIDLLLVPMMAMMLIGLAAFQFLGKYTALFLLLPFSYFIVTTPFALALSLLVILIFIGLNNAPMSMQSLVALSTICIHPIVGLPALFILAWSNLKKYPKLNNTAIYLGLGLLSSLTLPLIFLGVGKLAPHWPTINFNPNLDRHFDFWRDIINVYDLFIIPLLIVAAAWVSFQKYRPYFFAWLTTALSGLLVKTLITFPNLIFYEQENFSDRIMWLSLFFIFIPLLIFLKEKIAGLNFKSRLTKSLFFGILAVFLILSTYLSYPRKDVYQVAKGWSVSETDLAAVQKIDADAAGEPYIVLANQATSAAALKIYGFRYLQSNGDEFFFYPIPTSGKLYQYYLDIVYNNQGRSALTEAINYAGVRQGYFAISNYWWDAEKLRVSSKVWADLWFEVDGGKVTVFKLKLP